MQSDEENLEAIEILLRLHYGKLNDWEINFLEDIATGLEDKKHLSDKQQAKLDSMWNKII